MSKAEEIAALQRRVDELERERFTVNHKHVWRYRKSITVHPKGTFNEGRHVFWDWDCTDERCEYGGCGTNTSSHLPDHFPAELR